MILIKLLLCLLIFLFTWNMFLWFIGLIWKQGDIVCSNQGNNKYIVFKTQYACFDAFFPSEVICFPVNINGIVKSSSRVLNTSELFRLKLANPKYMFMSRYKFLELLEKGEKVL